MIISPWPFLPRLNLSLAIPFLSRSIPFSLLLFLSTSIEQWLPLNNDYRPAPAGIASPSQALLPADTKIGSPSRQKQPLSMLFLGFWRKLMLLLRQKKKPFPNHIKFSRSLPYHETPTWWHGDMMNDLLCYKTQLWKHRIKRTNLVIVPGQLLEPRLGTDWEI